MAQDVESRVLMRAGATKPDLEATLTDEEGSPLDLTNATVDVVATDWLATELWRNAATVAADPATGEVTYAWRPEDTATAGNYGLYFHVAWDTGDESDFPTSAPLEFVVAEPGTADLDPFVVPVDKVARRIGIPSPLTDELRDVLEDMVADVQADVEGYLGRPVVPVRLTELAVRDGTDPTGWRLRYDPVVRILSTSDTPNADGLWTVSYVAGITDRIAVSAIRRYVTGAAAEEFRAHPTYGKAYRSVRTTSAGGRSITYDQPSGMQRRSMAQLPAYPQPGSMPSIETLARWRRRGVFSRVRYVGPGSQAGGLYGIGSGIYLLGGMEGGLDGDPLFWGDARTGEVFGY